MYSILIMFIGLATAGWGGNLMWHSADLPEGFAAAKPYYITGGIIIFVGALINHWEHTRRGKE